MGVVHVSRGHNIRSTMAIKPEPTIIHPSGRGCRSSWARYHGEFGSDFDKIRDSIERVVPGFEATIPGLNQSGFELPNPPRDSRRFDTDSGSRIFITRG